MSYAQRRRFPWLLFLAGLPPDCHDGTRHDARASALPGLGALRFGHRAGALASAPTLESRTAKSSPTRVSTCWKAKKGRLPASIVVRQPGGKFQHLYSHVEGAPEFRIGEESLPVSLGAPGKAVLCAGLVAGNVSRAPRRALRQGNRHADSAEMPVFDPEAHAFTKMGVKNLRLDVFQERIRREVLRTLP